MKKTTVGAGGGGGGKELSQGWLDGIHAWLVHANWDTSSEVQGEI